MTDVVRTPSRFEIALGGGEVAFADYQIIGDSIVFPHTVTPRAFEGQGLASKLAQAALAYAREQGLMVRPHCGFFRAYIAKRPELHDLVHPDERAAVAS
ncbi:MAG: GNAT family N-acetyltransferase [Phenylobacterium sp.]|uniref:GNAT family N-acetyltransferase n=1 Tax=Phenylobacterium sp. TaxID=1871053 RepID=UPI0025FDC6E8|nr:GNAT family N-acetyltransferase [Phenylobacterium sp.]MBA4013154.1 GNAT family N-acetyltransferase [Phenylobacterium sp.]